MTGNDCKAMALETWNWSFDGGRRKIFRVRCARLSSTEDRRQIVYGELLDK